MTSPPRGHRWAPILNDVWQGRLENSLEPLHHISTHPDEPHPHMRKPVCTCLTPAPKQPTSTTALAWTPSNAPPSPSATCTAGCLVGLGGNGKERCAQKWASPLEGCANCRSVNSGNRQW